MAAERQTTLFDALRADLVFPDLAAQNAEGVLDELARRIGAALGGIAPAGLRAGFEERERLGSTALGGGLAIPHCKHPGLSSAVLAVGICPRGVAFGAPDEQPVRVFFAVVSPTHAPSAHLQLLAAISRWARSPGRLDVLLEARTPGELIAELSTVGETWK